MQMFCLPPRLLPPEAHAHAGAAAEFDRTGSGRGGADDATKRDLDGRGGVLQGGRVQGWMMGVAQCSKLG